ncbi:MAG TPA: DUF6600 domain-containing protein [Polyangiaceae bacterium]|nr:DUF6600 domain-containing protein [Polyangiaceae bacterium]
MSFRAVVSRVRAAVAVTLLGALSLARPSFGATHDTSTLGDTPAPGQDPAASTGADATLLASSGTNGAAPGDKDEPLLTSPTLQDLPKQDPNAPAAAPQTAAPPPREPQGNDASDADPRALTDFEPRLSPYGVWVDDPKYGRIWVPDRTIVGEGFSPYATGGHWALDSDDQWIWVSDYAFGDVVFHYGRWVWTTYGWAWVPGYRYAPAWVTWRVPTGSYAYVGWAPMPPTFYWVGGVAFWYSYPPPYYWVFCPSHYVFAPHPYRYFVTRPGYVRVIAGTTRHYGGSPRAYPVSPRLADARISAGYAPPSRVSSAALRGAAFASPSAARATPLRSYDTAVPHVAPSRTWATPPTSRTWAPAASRTWATPERSSVPVASRAWAPPSASPGTRVYTPPRPSSAPSTTWAPRAPAAAPTRVYSPPAPASPRAWSPSRPAAAPSRSWSPPAASPRVYSPARVYSPPAWHPSPSFGHPGGGGRHR